MAISDAPFGNEPSRDNNRNHRVTFSIGGVKTASHLAEKSGNKDRYEKARDDSTDPNNIASEHPNNYVSEE